MANNSVSTSPTPSSSSLASESVMEQLSALSLDIEAAKSKDSQKDEVNGEKENKVSMDRETNENVSLSSKPERIEDNFEQNIIEENIEIDHQNKKDILSISKDSKSNEIKNFSSERDINDEGSANESSSISDPESLIPPLKLRKKKELQLNIDIVTLFESVTTTEESYERRYKLVEKIQNIFDVELKDIEIKAYLFGSTENTLGMLNSDVDICILTPWHGFNDVRNLAVLLKKHGFSNINCISEAKVPIIKAWDPILKLACDINVNNPLALDNTQLIKSYAMLDPRVRPFAITIKYWSKQRLLNDAAAGGTLSTYSWVNLILNFLQTRNPPILPVLHALPYKPVECCGIDVGFFKNLSMLEGFGHANKETLGGLLYSFFRKYAYEFDYDKDVVSLRTGRILDKKEKGWVEARGNHFFCIEEPFNVTRNIANSCDKVSVDGLRAEFKRACDILHTSASLYEVCQAYYPGEDEDEFDNFDSSFMDLYDEDAFSVSEHILRYKSKVPEESSTSNNDDQEKDIKSLLKQDIVLSGLTAKSKKSACSLSKLQGKENKSRDKEGKTRKSYANSSSVSDKPKAKHSRRSTRPRDSSRSAGRKSERVKQSGRLSRDEAKHASKRISESQSTTNKQIKSNTNTDIDHSSS